MPPTDSAGYEALLEATGGSLKPLDPTAPDWSLLHFTRHLILELFLKPVRPDATGDFEKPFEAITGSSGRLLGTTGDYRKLLQTTTNLEHRQA